MEIETRAENGDGVESTSYHRSHEGPRKTSLSRTIDPCLDKVQQSHHAPGSRRRFEKRYLQRSRRLSDECKDRFHEQCIAAVV